MSGYPKSAAQVRHMEHDSDAPETKKVSMYGYDSDALSKVRITASADGYLRIALMAEDADSPGVYEEVQGQYDSDGKFRLLGAGDLKYDLIDLTYVTSGNGVGEIGTVVYSLDSVPVKTLTLTYDDDNKLISVSES